ncbi:sigma-54-dependent Fis family transcriptional regulator [Comamonas serinivorans]|uniref:Sigma-54-dependent Fis family transcriptional regulator n=1 Tax=Comamonas serinivorans TaxID=1082851 RepID=A0A1Y0ETB1_9BURK|nr:sigma-54-dependent Fis family transcriptional regulator [Comamonas serinivorans]
MQQARRHLLEQGVVLPSALDDRLARSWQRSWNAGLAPDSRGEGQGPVTGPSFARLLQRNAQLLAFARPVMDFIYRQVRGHHSMLVLADAHSTLMHTVGDDGFLDQAQRVALRCGESWHERERGTNAIGTAVAERTALQVRAGEHYLAQNGFLHCSAAPVFTAQGEVAGVIDISGDAFASQPHALVLANSAARMVENSWLKSRYPEHVRIHLHPQAEGLDTPAEGIVVLTTEGVLVGGNPEGMRMLGLSTGDCFSLRLEDRLQHRLAKLLAQAGKLPQALYLPDGERLHMRVHRPEPRVLRPAPRARPNQPASAPSRPATGASPVAAPEGPDALARCDTGDSLWQRAARQARRLLHTPVPLLILGESGVGKEVFARACHDSGPRAGQPFVAINCAAIPESLIEAELFGYAPGAYTGAQRSGSPGRIREADGGTLFLDEIGHMPVLLQTRLLRVLQERQVTPLGGGPPAGVDFALMSATHAALDEAVADGRFRRDLYYRINGFALRLPALRERSDFDALALRILRGFMGPGEADEAQGPADAPGAGKACEGAGALPVAPDLLAALRRYDWPGNVRQLSSVLQTACALREPHEAFIGWQHLADDVREALRRHEPGLAGAGVEGVGYDTAAAATTHPVAKERAAAGAWQPGPDTGSLKQLSHQVLQRTLQTVNGNVSEAARRLGISRQTVYRRLRSAS